MNYISISLKMCEKKNSVAQLNWTIWSTNMPCVFTPMCLNSCYFYLKFSFSPIPLALCFQIPLFLQRPAKILFSCAFSLPMSEVYLVLSWNLLILPPIYVFFFFYFLLCIIDCHIFYLINFRFLRTRVASSIEIKCLTHSSLSKMLIKSIHQMFIKSVHQYINTSAKRLLHHHHLSQYDTIQSLGLYN